MPSCEHHTSCLAATPAAQLSCWRQQEGKGRGGGGAAAAWALGEEGLQRGRQGPGGEVAVELPQRPPTAFAAVVGHEALQLLERPLHHAAGIAPPPPRRRHGSLHTCTCITQAGTAGLHISARKAQRRWLSQRNFWHGPAAAPGTRQPIAAEHSSFATPAFCNFNAVRNDARRYGCRSSARPPRPVAQQMTRPQATAGRASGQAGVRTGAAGQHFRSQGRLVPQQVAPRCERPGGVHHHPLPACAAACLPFYAAVCLATTLAHDDDGSALACVTFRPSNRSSS